MNTKLKIVLMLFALVGLVLGAGLAFTGCATTHPTQVHGAVTIAGPTPIVTGPAKGHWAEQDGHAVIAYTVLGTECSYLAGQNQSSTSFDTHGDFIVGPGVTLCLIPLRGKEQTILFHAERP